MSVQIERVNAYMSKGLGKLQREIMAHVAPGVTTDLQAVSHLVGVLPASFSRAVNSLVRGGHIQPINPASLRVRFVRRAGGSR